MVTVSVCGHDPAPWTSTCVQGPKNYRRLWPRRDVNHPQRRHEGYQQCSMTMSRATIRSETALHVSAAALTSLTPSSGPHHLSAERKGTRAPASFPYH